MRDHIDIIITSDQFLNSVLRDDLSLTLLSDHPWVLAMNKDNPLAQREVVPLAELEEENIITMNEGSVSTVRREFRGMVPFRSIDYVNSLEAKLLLTNAGRGVSFIPPLCGYLPLCKHCDPPHRAGVPAPVLLRRVQKRQQQPLYPDSGQHAGQPLQRHPVDAQVLSEAFAPHAKHPRPSIRSGRVFF